MGSDSRGADHKSFIAGSNQMDHFKNIKIIDLTFARNLFQIIQNNSESIQSRFQRKIKLVTPTEIQPISQN